jgi:hypothetical protein
MYEDYVYRSPNTSEDVEAVSIITRLIDEENIKTVSEVGGNNGVFAKKILDKALNIDEYLIWDKVKNSKTHPKLHFKNEFLTKSTEPTEVDLVIVRHAFAHNASISKFADNIIEKFNPDFIYIECADWFETLVNRDFSQLYSEHFYCLSGKAIAKLFHKENYAKLTEIKLGIHNGSFGLLLSRKVENKKFITEAKSYDVSREIKAWVTDVNDFWYKLKTSDLNIWACSAKFIFTINALELKNIEKIKIVIDSTEDKHNKFPPGLFCPVSPELKTIKDENLNFIIGARNFASQVENKIRTLSTNYSAIIPPF